jgi:hypothetical protein
MSSDDQQMKLMERLKIALLEDFMRLYEEGKLSPTDRRTIFQMLKENGWTLDPSRIPQSLVDSIKDKYKLPDPKLPEDEDPI